MIRLNYTKYGSNADFDSVIDKGNIEEIYNLVNTGYGLDRIRLKYGTKFDWYIAGQGYMLDELIYSDDEEVRGAIADNGYGLDVLAFDGWPYVRMCVSQYLLVRGFESVGQWAARFPERCALVGKKV